MLTSHSAIFLKIWHFPFTSRQSTYYFPSLIRTTETDEYVEVTRQEQVLGATLS